MNRACTTLMQPGGEVVVVGGGLAGLAAAFRLAESGMAVRLFESRRTLGGRAGSYTDDVTGETIDHCQHVAMGCCTHFNDLIDRAGLRTFFRRDRVITFIDRSGRTCQLSGNALFPAPLHLLPSLLRLDFLTLSERLGIARTLWRLARTAPDRLAAPLTIKTWLIQQLVSESVIDHFWSPILVSALSESLDKISLAYARQVLVDGFMTHPDAYCLDIPQLPLGTLYGSLLRSRLEERGVAIHLGRRIDSITLASDDRISYRVDGRDSADTDQLILAVPWRAIGKTLDAKLTQQMELTSDEIASGAIAGIHLWFDRPLTSHSHAVLLDRTSQWLFARGRSEVPDRSGRQGYYYQVVVSAAHSQSETDRNKLTDEVVSELVELGGSNRRAECWLARVVTQHHAVFSPCPGADRHRPSQKTCVPGLILAGDWTETGWPATMEGAVISGYRAAAEALRQRGHYVDLHVAPLATSWLARLGKFRSEPTAQ